MPLYNHVVENLKALHSDLVRCMMLSLENHCVSYLNDVEDNILVEAVQDTLGYSVVIPGSVDKQQILQVFELCGREVKGQDE